VADTTMMSIAAVVRRRILGVAFILLLCGLVALSIGVYFKAFTPVVRVKLVTDRIGNQLLVGSDVKLRGIIVGEVRHVHANGQAATVDLALQPSKTGLIPANVTARLLPKTLFGERFVDLVLPAAPLPTPIKAGEVIRQDKSTRTLELERVFDDLLPLLRTLSPAKVNATLYALATALQGRGEQLGRNLVSLDAYLRQLNPEMPTIKADIVGLATLAETYADAAPDLLATLSNLSVTNTTVTQQQAQVRALFRSTTSLADTADAFFATHEQRLIAVNQVTQPILALVARYSPEFPCLLKDLTDFEPLLEKAFADRRLHITIEIVQQRDKYRPGQDDPAYGEHRGPRCYQRYTGAAQFPGPAPDIRDGSRGPNVYTPLGLPPLLPLPPVPPLGRALSDVLLSADQGPAGTAQERDVIDPLLAPVMGVPSDKVPGIATLLFGPMARGAVVGLS
jgi:phospholipid/cholesterol/gamma-HCH transport system substrate-binding protein